MRLNFTKIFAFVLTLFFGLQQIVAQSGGPTIQSFSPSSGPVGTLVTINGTNLESHSHISIGGMTALPISTSATQLVAMVMPGSVNGSVSVTNIASTVNSASSFTVLPTPIPRIQQGEKLVGTGNVGNATQGYSVAISADGNTAVVGGFSDNNFQGAAWIFTRSGQTWSQQGAKLVVTGNEGPARVGQSVAISEDGNTVLLGGHADNNNQGAAWVFTRSGTTWTQQGNKLVGSNNIGAARQGFSVSLSANGNVALIGGYGDNNFQGAAWVFNRTAGVWSQGFKLIGSGNAGQAWQGYSVALSGNGYRAVVGGYNDNNGVGAVWVFNNFGIADWMQSGNKLVGASTSTSGQYQGISVAISADGNTIASGGAADNHGVGGAWVFRRSDGPFGTWSEEGTKLVASDHIGQSNQGMSVALSANGNILVVGGRYDDTNKGGAWTYRRNGTTWTQQGNKLLGTGAVGASQQGFAVAISADATTAIVGGPSDNGGRGAAWIFVPETPCGIINLNNDTQDLQGNSFVFNANPHTAGNTYSWNFGDGSAAVTGQQATHTYTQAGTYTVTLTINGITTCNINVTVTDGVSGGAGGGIESYSLGEVIGKRNMAKAKAGQLGETNYGATPKWDGPVSNDRGGIQMQGANMRLRDLIPSQVPGLQAFVTSPTDLTQFTNAVEVMSVDFTRSNVARAVTFATKTMDEVYNHTKPICDRLRGAQLLDVQKVTLANNVDMLSYTIRQANGKVEYAVSFSAGAKNGRNNLNIESKWFTKDYVNDEVMYNFQVWAETPTLLRNLTEDILSRLSNHGSLVQARNNAQLPSAYVVAAQRVGSKLILTIQNNSANGNGYFELEEKLNEKAAITKRTVPFNIQQQGRSTVEMDMRDGFESDIRMYVGGEVVDLVYMSDGIWGLEFDRARTTIRNFIVSNDAGRTYSDEFPLFRNVRIEGTTSDYITAYKFVRGGGIAADLTAYKTLRFEASGGHRLKVTLVKEGVKDWKDQYTYSINLDQEKRTYEIGLNEFVSAGISGKIKATDITTVVFSIEVNGARTTINNTLGKVGFTKTDIDYLRSLEVKDLELFPNPSTGRFTLQFRSALEAPLTMRMTDASTGRVIVSRAVQAIKGENQVTIELGRNQNITSQGLYIINLDGNNGLRYKPTKISIKR